MAVPTPSRFDGKAELSTTTPVGAEPIARMLKAVAVPGSLKEAVDRDGLMRDWFKDTPDEWEAWLMHAGTSHKKEGPLTAEQSKAVYLYTLESSFYKRLNTVLRECHINRCGVSKPLPYLRLLSEALSRAPPYEGTVYRCIGNLEDDAVFKYYEGKVGATVTWYQVNSCTKHLSQLDGFLNGNYVVFVIEGVRGADVSGYSAVWSEEEVVLFSCSRFKVLSVICKGSLCMVQLEAVHEEHEEFYDLHGVAGTVSSISKVRETLREEEKRCQEVVTQLSQRSKECEAARTLLRTQGGEVTQMEAKLEANNAKWEEGEKEGRDLKAQVSRLEEQVEKLESELKCKDGAIALLSSSVVGAGRSERTPVWLAVACFVAMLACWALWSGPSEVAPRECSGSHADAEYLSTLMATRDEISSQGKRVEALAAALETADTRTHVASLSAQIEKLAATITTNVPPPDTVGETNKQRMKRSRTGKQSGGSVTNVKKANTVQTFKRHHTDRTSLLIASSKGHADVVSVLLGAKDTQDENGRTALFIASEEGHADVVRALLGAGANKEKQNASGRTPLYVASYEGHVEVVRALLVAGADKDRRNHMGRTPLIVASLRGHADIVRTLLAAGADKRIATRDGETARDAARRNGHTAVVSLLS